MNSQARLDEMNAWLLKHDITLCDIDMEEGSCVCLEDLWNKPNSKIFIWMACHALDKRSRISFGVDLADRFKHLLRDQRSRDILEVCQRYSKGMATDEELKNASVGWEFVFHRRNYLSDTRENAAADCVALVSADKVSMAASSATVAAYDGGDNLKSEWLWQNSHMRTNYKPDWSL